MTPNIKGEWVSPTGQVFSERMIPVRIYCQEDQILTIAKFTKEYYKQEAILYYCVAENVCIV